MPTHNMIHDPCRTWSGGVPTAGHPAVLPAGLRVSGVTPGRPLVVGVPTVVAVQSSDKQMGRR